MTQTIAESVTDMPDRLGPLAPPPRPDPYLPEPELAPLALPPQLAAAGAARAYIGEVCRRRHLGNSVCEDLRLLTTEVVTNAVIHAGTYLEVSVTIGDFVRVMVRDVGTGKPEIVTARQVGGWGLQLVDELSDRWGVLPADPGEVVWFDIALQ